MLAALRLFRITYNVQRITNNRLLLRYLLLISSHQRNLSKCINPIFNSRRLFKTLEPLSHQRAFHKKFFAGIKTEHRTIRKLLQENYAVSFIYIVCLKNAQKIFI